MQYCGLATLTLQPTSVDDIEMLAKRYLLKDVYEFVSSGSANQCTLKENRIAYTRYIKNINLIIIVAKIVCSKIIVAITIMYTCCTAILNILTMLSCILSL